MKTYPPLPYIEPSEKLDGIIRKLDPLANFDVWQYIDAKIKLLDDYFKYHSVKGVVIGISGGIDSAVTLAILSEYRNIYSDDFEIYPIFVSEKLSGDNLDLATSVTSAAGFELLTVHASDSAKYVVETLGLQNVQSADWIQGQSISYHRQSILYTAASALSDDKGGLYLVAGTINRDEGAYIGYTCKAGDGMVDIQIISDIGKLEVYEVAKALQVAQESIDVAPKGDMFDGRDDYDVFGTSYVGVRLAQLLASRLHDNHNHARVINCGEEVDRILTNVQQLHVHNRHKYLVGSPAVHLDVFPLGIKGGWTNRFHRELNGLSFTNSEHIDRLVCNAIDWHLDIETSDAKTSALGIISAKNVLQPKLHKALLDVRAYTDECSYQTDQHGTTIPRYALSTPVHSNRWAFNSKNLAKYFEQELNTIVPKLLLEGDGEHFTFIGMNPYFRVIEYVGDGILMPHLDRPYADDRENLYAKLTVVTYLTDCVGGQTRVVHPKDDVTIMDIDWDRPATEDEVLEQFDVESNTVIIFDGTKFYHDSAPIVDGTKAILISELFYSKIKNVEYENNLITSLLRK